MNLRKTMLAASIAALPLMMATNAHAAGPMMAAPISQASPQENASLVAKLAARPSSKGLDAAHGYAVAAQHAGEAGTRISRARHTYNGLRVFGSESVVVTNAAGDIVSESVSDRRGGLDAPGSRGLAASASSRAGAPDLTPALSSTAAIDKVVKAVAPRGTHRWAPQAELLIYPVMKSVRVAAAVNKPESALNAMDLEEVVERYELAYLVKTRMADNGKLVFHDTVVNAKTGAVIAQWQALQTVVGTGNSQYNGAVPINTTLSGGTYSMKDASRGVGGTFGGMAITNANHAPESNPTPGTIYTNTSNTWGDGQQYVSGGSTTNANGQTAAVNAMWGLMNTYDTMKNVLGWQSLDGNNTATYIAVHVDNNYDNAFFDPNCKCMYIGDGGTSFKNLGSIDVIGHEMGHGVIDATSDLVYSGESGGLNESNSDIAGEMTEAYARAGGTGNLIPASGNDWQMGTEISKSGQPLRWMIKPSKDGSSPNQWSTTLKNLNVHYSSGPNNRMFYFLSQGSSSSSSNDAYSSYLTKQPLAMTGIGNDKAFRIWFKAATTKFTSSTNYADARNKVLLAAEELYGVGSKEATAVKRAYAAINVGTDVDEVAGGVTIGTQPASITVAPGATASFTVGASGGTAPYAYKWYRNGALISGATAATYSFTAQQADSGAVFKATVTDSSSTPVTVTSGNATLTVNTITGVERVTNGGFESGATGWSGSTGVIGSYSGQTAFEGSKFAWLGGNGSTATETLTQSVAIPSTATSAALTFALHIDTAETTTSTAYDKLVVTVKNTSGAVLGTLATYSNLNKATGYQTRSFSLLPYKGQTVQLSFAMTEDSSAQTSFVVDKVSLITQ
ncbi:M4 family metallopeptidase [Pseudoduganella namucuonensis]|uniref:Zn-dependent metalloprotease n=1 Tax=Pseudoduganella namucuonensis TaxID=1035707 RepID=A0A1I7JWM1_9BURK|nr:M4 family metallopeptidase [Pseudoduganella namucuonensis]SFU89598.1 Zn-dependent metalloprotease [Pseudoduganella namucuonensis]